MVAQFLLQHFHGPIQFSELGIHVHVHIENPPNPRHQKEYHYPNSYCDYRFHVVPSRCYFASKCPRSILSPFFQIPHLRLNRSPIAPSFAHIWLSADQASLSGPFSRNSSQGQISIACALKVSPLLGHGVDFITCLESSVQVTICPGFVRP